MDWDPVSFIDEYQDVIMPEFKKLEHLGSTTSTLAQLQSMAALQYNSPPMFRSLHFGFNAIAVICCLALISLGLYRCYTVTMAWQKQQQDIQLAAAVRQALAMSPAPMEKMDFDSCPQYGINTPLPGSRPFSMIGSVSNTQLYPKTT